MKVEIPREVADAIETMYAKAAKSEGVDFEYIISRRIKQDFNDTYDALNHVDVELLAKALINGYTVKPKPITLTITPEQQRRLLGKINLLIDRYEKNEMLLMKRTLMLVGLDTDGEKVRVVKEDD